MCGISGTYGFGADTEDIARRMSGALAHRGPDGEGLFTDGAVSLAHRRLAIIDREHGAQPMTTADGRYTIVYNGETYNYLELRAELEELGHTFRTDSDTEVLLEAHAEWGTAAYDRFNGMFAFAIHDAETGTVTLARDHFGIKPLYYWVDPEAGEGDPRVLFGSEIRSLLAAKVFDAAPDDRAVYRYLKFRVQDDDSQTFFAGVRRLMAGELLEIRADGTEISTFTSLKEELREIAARPGRPYDDSVVEEYRERFQESVRMRLQSEVPVGTSLSGGLDSSAVAAVIARHLREQPDDEGYSAVGSRQNTFSAVFPQASNDEERYVDALLDDYRGQITAHKIQPRPEAFLEDVHDFVRTQEEPIISTGPYAQYAVMREASEHVTVLLDGQGADEMMAGYNPYFYVYLRQLRRQKRFTELAGEVVGSRDILRKLARTKFSGRTSVPIEALLNSGFVAEHSGEKVTSVQDDLKERLLEDTFRSSLPSLLRYEDKNTMRFSIEGRVPFVDKELLKFLFSLDESAIIHDGWNKRILRESMDGILPDMISKRRNKIGFTTPEGEWFRTIAPQLREIFASPSFAARPYFDAPSVLALFDDYIAHPENHGTLMFWRLLNVELWMRTFFDDADGAGRALGGSAETGAAPAVTPAAAAEAPVEEDEEPKSDYAPNPDKQLDLTSEADGHDWRRFPLQTSLVARGDDIEALVRGHVERFAAGLPADAVPAGAPWYFVISEKIVAIAQGRSWFTWEVRPRRAAKVLSRFVSRTPAGIGLGDPTTMELAIREVGLPRVLAASAAGAAGKLVRRKGLFYEVVGANVRAIDGPTPYSAFPSNVSAKLPPKDPDAVSARISAAIRGADIPAALRDSFVGTVVMDANDIGRNVLGSDVPTPATHLEATFADNPLGQGRQRTPLAILVDLGIASTR
ncbi:asparagine synthase (glutamine-hydrolyzing) [Brachybacterium saurashtrense]|uniref:asparagine synthase (glutamine-hydrolyzing) n=1 Tax=Brachybacterium saurashtrense TaxID=556288 RepID=A0A345YL01_9MICO|nr:asparagine synthase (glutamine-hydrolyzing) [Brachybacterium saurashtrense]AXK44603.1 asparagine synthase (glutamine-hydrolyzing) [Brachybacterium saurashtrense]RRR23215.1 asparagine synthase (glutamine-hydrolyzing) [Brachybacterium saurashtrense]